MATARRGAKPLGGADFFLEGEFMARNEELARLKAVLLTRHEALRQALAGDLSLLKELNHQSSGDVIDFALDSAQDELCSQLAEVESRELASIENALQRMREGEYGKCEVCDEGIPTARLQALPYATLCINCQREVERQGGYGSAPADWGRIIDNSIRDNEVSLRDLELDYS